MKGQYYKLIPEQFLYPGIAPHASFHFLAIDTAQSCEIQENRLVVFLLHKPWPVRNERILQVRKAARKGHRTSSLAVSLQVQKRETEPRTVKYELLCALLSGGKET